jgi:hypothetical protein
VTACHSSGGGSQRTRWSCSGDFAPSGGGAGRRVTFATSERLAPGERLTADAAGTSSDSVRPRTSPLTVALLCPLLIVAVVVVGGLRLWRRRAGR